MATAEAPPAAPDLPPLPPTTEEFAVPASLRPWRDPSPRTGWLITAVVVAVAAFTRFWALGWPHGQVFDEVYYDTESKELLRFGYEDNRGYMFIVHPPVGKWLIALPQWLFHTDDETGWRLASAIAGTVAVLLMVRIARRMFHSNVFGGIAGLLLALEGTSVVLSRIALLDIFLQVFLFAAFGALVLDRAQMRARLAALLADGADLSDGSPSLGPRPWRLLAGVLFGIANAVKWTALAFFIVFVIMALVWDRGAFKAAGVRRPWRVAVRRSWIGAIGSLLIAPVGIYLLCWLGWFAGENSWGRHWADTHGGSTKLTLPLGLRIPFNWDFLPGAVRSLGAYHLQAYRFAQTLYSPHPYGSKPWSWLVLGRPVDLYYHCDSLPGGGCDRNGQVHHMLLIGTPVEWWAFTPALIWLAWHYVTTRDWRAAPVWVAFLAGWLFWFQNLKRTMFLFYMAPLVPFLIIGLTLALGTIIGPATTLGQNMVEFAAAQRRRLWGTAVVSVFLGLVVIDFVWMWPLYTAGRLSYNDWNLHMWFPSWV